MKNNVLGDNIGHNFGFDRLYFRLKAGALRVKLFGNKEVNSLIVAYQMPNVRANATFLQLKLTQLMLQLAGFDNT